MAQQVVFAWGKEFETNIKQVDSEHRYLVEIINSLGNKLAAQGTSLSDVEPFFQELLSYSKYHFSNEEGLMLEAGVDPRHAKEHLKAHKIFIKEVTSKYKNLNSNNIKVEAKELLDFLVQWLTFHILGIDKNLSAQIRLIKSGYTPEQAYEEVSGVNHEQLDTLVKSFNGVFGVLLKYNEELLALKNSLEEKIEQRTKELIESNKKLEYMAMTDQLTGLANRRRMSYELETCLQKYVDSKVPFTIIMFDLDNFKTINDTFGHDAGDAVIVKFSDVLKFNLRTDDIICRIGGDEFLAICPNTDTDGALKIATKIHKQINKIRITFENACWIGSASVGVVTVNDKIAAKEKILKAADKSVYDAKNTGKNKVIFFK
jgi:hypothetical protein